MSLAVSPNSCVSTGLSSEALPALVLGIIVALLSALLLRKPWSIIGLVLGSVIFVAGAHKTIFPEQSWAIATIVGAALAAALVVFGLLLSKLFAGKIKLRTLLAVLVGLIVLLIGFFIAALGRDVTIAGGVGLYFENVVGPGLSNLFDGC